MDADDRDEGSSSPDSASAMPSRRPPATVRRGRRRRPAAAAVRRDAPGPAPRSKPAAAAAARPRRRRCRRVRDVVHLPRTRQGRIALLLVLGALFTFFVVGATSVIAWTETADFCGRCHTMGPELARPRQRPALRRDLRRVPRRARRRRLDQGEDQRHPPAHRDRPRDLPGAHPAAGSREPAAAVGDLPALPPPGSRGNGQAHHPDAVHRGRGEHPPVRRAC